MARRRPGPRPPRRRRAGRRGPRRAGCRRPPSRSCGRAVRPVLEQRVVHVGGGEVPAEQRDVRAADRRGGSPSRRAARGATAAIAARPASAAGRRSIAFGVVRVQPDALAFALGERPAACPRSRWGCRCGRGRGAGRPGARSTTSRSGIPAARTARAARSATPRECPENHGDFRSAMSAMTSSAASNSASSSGGRGSGSASITRSHVVARRGRRGAPGAAVERAARRRARTACRRGCAPASTAPSTPCSRWWTSTKSAICISRTDIGTLLGRDTPAGCPCRPTGRTCSTAPRPRRPGPGRTGARVRWSARSGRGSCASTDRPAAGHDPGGRAAPAPAADRRGPGPAERVTIWASWDGPT